MAAINDLIAQIENAELRERITREVERMSKQKKFGLVFEEHLPECTPLYDIPVKAGSHVALKNGNMNDIYSVIAVNGDKALCFREVDNTQCELPLADLTCVAQFGEPIYPYLKPLDTVCNAPDSDLWHTLIEADNYHALQFLDYLYGGKVDCIYIDPPYNTGAKDWKYNNDYVDSNDTYRHSKWLSMMKKRLELAKRLLNPADSVLIVTIDEKEYLHLGCLLEEIFPKAQMQMVTIVTNPFGQERIQQFARVEEYAFFLFFGQAAPVPQADDFLNVRENDNIENLGEAAEEVTPPTEHVRWERLLRGGADALRTNNPRLFYPVFIDPIERKVHSVGEAIPLEQDRNEIAPPEGCITVWPIKTNGAEGRWRCSPSYFRELLSKGCARIGEHDKVNDRWTLLYLSKATMKRIESKEIEILGNAPDGSLMLGHVPTKTPLYTVKTVWNRGTHRAGEWGTRYIRNLLPGRMFTYPKSLYAVKDSLKVITQNKPNALILDFFAGSGTTLHAVNLLNAEDGGHRRCILVTNNEVSADEAKGLTAQGYQPGDGEWEKLGIARYVTWPRTVCSIKGHDVNGQPLKGTYLGSDIPMSEGFRANAAFFKLGFLDKTEVKLGRQFKELLPVLWLKAGAVGRCPALESDTLPDMLILPENKFAVLLQETAFAEFEQKMKDFSQIQTVFIVTDYEPAYVSMSARLNVQTTYQLYRDYLDHFRINIRRQ